MTTKPGFKVMVVFRGKYLKIGASTAHTVIHLINL